MQILNRAGEELPFFSRPPRNEKREYGNDSGDVEKVPEPIPSVTPPASLASLDFVSKATSGAAAALRSASSRARRALVELKEDLVGDIIVELAGGPSQHTPQQQQSQLQPPPLQQQQLQQSPSQLEDGEREAQQQQQLPVPLALQQHALSQGPGWALPWSLKSESDRQREEVKRRIRELAKEPSRFLVPLSEPVLPPEGGSELAAASVAASLEDDACLRTLREELVPRMLSDTEFWSRYFRAVKDIEMDIFCKQSSSAAGTSPLPSSPEAPSASSISSVGLIVGRSSAFAPWAVLTGPRVVSQVRSFDVDSDEQVEADFAAAAHAGGMSGRSESERIGETIQGQLDTCQRCASEGGPDCLRQACLCPEKALAPSLSAALDSPCSGLLRELSSVSAEPLSGTCSTEGGEAEVVGHVLWPQRAPFGDGATVCSSSPSKAEAQQAELDAVVGVTSSEFKGTEACADSSGIPSSSKGCNEGMPSSLSLRNIISAGMMSAGYSSCTELVVMDLSSMWPRLGPLSAMAEGFRRQSLSGNNRGLSPPRWAPWAAEEHRPLSLVTSPPGVSVPQPTVQQRMADLLFEVAGSSSRGACARLGPCFSRSMHGAPPGSFVAHLAASLAGLDSAQEMAQLWLEVVKKLREHFEAGEPIPGVAYEGLQQPDLQLCEIMQNLQMLNLCMKRRKERKERLAQAKRLEMPGGEDGSNQAKRDNDSLPISSASSLERRGVKEVIPGVFLLETGEPLCVPETQDTQLMTETTLREQEEQIMRTGTMGSGCEQLLSDMQAFKSANPGCLLEDFVRWYSPPDWSPVPYSLPGETPASTDSGREDAPAQAVASSSVQDQVPAGPASERAVLSKRGYLSFRMTFSGNMWQELWQDAKAVPAIEQLALFDEEAGGKRSLRWLEDIAPAELLDQIFITLVGLGLSAGQALPEASQEPFRRSLKECGRYLCSSCSKGMGTRKQEIACLVYEVLEAARSRATQGVERTVGAMVGVPDPNFVAPLEAPAIPFGSENVHPSPVSVGLQGTALAASPLVEHPSQMDANSLVGEEGRVGDLDDTLEACPSSQSLAPAGGDQDTLSERHDGARVSEPAATPAKSLVHDQFEADVVSCDEELAGDSQAGPSAGSAGSALGLKEDASAGLRQAAALLLQRMRPRPPNWGRTFSFRTLQGFSAMDSQPGTSALFGRQPDALSVSDKAEWGSPWDSGRVSPLRCDLSDSDFCSLGSGDERDSLTEDVSTPKSSGWMGTGLSERFWARPVEADPVVSSLGSAAVALAEEEKATLSQGSGSKPLWKLGEKSLGKLFAGGCKAENAGAPAAKEKELDGEWVIL